MNNAIETRRVRNDSIISTLMAKGGIVIDEKQNKTVRLTHLATFGVEGEYEAVIGLIDGVAVNVCGVDFRDNRLVLLREALGNRINGENLPMEERVRTYRDWEDNSIWGVTRIW